MGEGVTRVFTPEERKYRAARQAERVAKNRVNGLCGCGRKPPRAGKLSCDLCAKVSSEGTKIRRKSRKEAAVCVKCELPSIPGQTMCETCAQDTKAYYDARKQSGKCVICGGERPPNRQTCEDCRIKRNIQSGKRRGYSISKWKKRGRRIITENDRVVSHEEVVRGSMKKAALNLASSGTCACGMPIPKAKRGRMVRCESCAYKMRTERQRKYHREHRAKTNAEYGPRVLDDLEAAKKERAFKDAFAARCKAWRAQRRKAGLCVRCVNKAIPGRPVCATCAQKQKDEYHKRKATP